MRFPNIGTCCLLLIGADLFVPAQETKSVAATTDKPTIEALLLEVRQLRLALERSTSLVPRIQLAAQRFQLQQTRVDRLSTELRDFRTKMAEESAHKADELRQLQAMLNETKDTSERARLESAVRERTAMSQQESPVEQQRMAQEAELASQLQREQGTLRELSDQLDTLDKKLQESPDPCAKGQ
jgi:septal ring factor EnvC (AmiA/AmiB activator)